MAGLPTGAADVEYQRRFAPLGLLDAESPYVDADPELAAASSPVERPARPASRARPGTPAPRQNGWQVSTHIFDYNLDHFELGALDDPQWKLADNPTRYMQRALSARGGLWGNHAYEAAYAMSYLDGDGQRAPLRPATSFGSPAHRPARAFWSVTMYDTPDFYLVANQINRYSIGDRTPGLATAPDGSLTIVIQRDEPSEPERRANWLPTPGGGVPAHPAHVRAGPGDPGRRIQAPADQTRRLSAGQKQGRPP